MTRFFSRRTFLSGAGATIALPFFESLANAEPRQRARLVCIEMVYGSAGSTKYGVSKNLWAPAAEGRNFELSAGSLSPLEPFRKYLTIVSNTDVAAADSPTPRDAGADHMRSTAAFLTQSRPKPTVGADVRAGLSLDQLVAQRFAGETPIPSLQLCIEDTRHGSGFQTNYSNIYRDTLSWASPTTPLPAIRDPRAIFDQLFRVSESYGDQSSSILDWVVKEIPRLSMRLGASDRQRLESYLTDIREVERRIQAVETFNKSGETRVLAAAPPAVPDDFEEHVRIMFDLQVQALASGITRIISFKLALDGVVRSYPNSGVSEGFHGASHHGEHAEKIELFARINRYHVGLLPYFLSRLQDIREGDKNLLEKTVVLYGSPMGDSNFHNHRNCPLFFVGFGNGALPGNRHVRAPEGTPMANAMLGLLHGLSLEDVASFGDSTGVMSLL